MKRAKFRNLKEPEGVIPLGPPFSGIVQRMPFDVAISDERRVFYPGHGWGVSGLSQAPHGEGLAWYTGCGLSIFAGPTLERVSQLKLFHISIRFPDGVSPTYAMMNALRDAFFPPDVDVIQVHPKHDKYVNVAEHVYHLWQFPGHWDIVGV